MQIFFVQILEKSSIIKFYEIIFRADRFLRCGRTEEQAGKRYKSNIRNLQFWKGDRERRLKIRLQFSVSSVTLNVNVQGHIELQFVKGAIEMQTQRTAPIQGVSKGTGRLFNVELFLLGGMHYGTLWYKLRMLRGQLFWSCLSTYSDTNRHHIDRRTHIMKR